MLKYTGLLTYNVYCERVTAGTDSFPQFSAYSVRYIYTTVALVVYLVLQDAAGRRGSTPHSGHHQLLLGHLTPPEPAPRTHLPPQLPEGNPPIPLRRNQSLRRVGQNSDDGPSVPPRHSSRDRLELPPPPIPPKSPEPTSLNRAMEVSLLANKNHHPLSPLHVPL